MKIDKEIDIQKYKRFFAFGCSFTNYAWPTWADYLGRNIGEYYNFGGSGSGNMLIFQQFIQCMKKYEFTENDLVIIQWTNTTREDRYIDGEWRRNGNLETQGDGLYKNKNYVIDYRGMFFRDLGFISAAKKILEKEKCDWDFLLMVPLTLDIGIPEEKDFGHSHHIHDLKKFFSDELAASKPSFYEILNGWDNFRKVEFLDNGVLSKDYHPTPDVHRTVLNKLYSISNSKNEIDTYIDMKTDALFNTKVRYTAELLFSGMYDEETKSHSSGQFPVIW